MSSAIRSQSASQQLIERWWTGTGEENQPTPSGSSPPRIATFEVSVPSSSISKKHTAFDALLMELESDPSNAQDLAEAGAWVADNFYKDDGETLKTARLRKGLSQKQLASLIGTSQPHIATLESGRVEPNISTAQKLCEVLNLNFGDIPAILERQKALNSQKGKK
ncbi:helix-turn-helix transcriptional regulator [Azorhizophilus paspali]|uniref:Helix-turn-helix transcriptional regulator n=1 Tax=Azorhizophilus paspali TaxID=69963 RepID=A0ABV6SJ28_AZOPA